MIDTYGYFQTICQNSLSLAVMKSVGILVVGWLTARLFSRWISNAISRSKDKQEILIFLSNFVFYGIFIASVIAAVSELGVDTNSFLAVLGGAAIAVGLGLKNQLSQLVAGIVLIIRRPFRIGDDVSISGKIGTVELIDFFQTILRTKSNSKIVIPNNTVTSGLITNFSTLPTRRVKISSLISQDEDLKETKELLIETLKTVHEVKSTPLPEVKTVKIKDKVVECVMSCWVSTRDYDDAASIILEKLQTVCLEKEYFKRFPQTSFQVISED